MLTFLGSLAHSDFLNSYYNFPALSLLSLNLMVYFHGLLQPPQELLSVLF